MSRDINLLSKTLLDKFKKMEAEIEKHGYDLICTCSYRSNEEQAKLYAIGRTVIGKRVTDAKPGQSKHNRKPAEAFDVAIAMYGKCIWDPKHFAWRLVKEIGIKLGLKQLLKESCHFELK